MQKMSYTVLAAAALLLIGAGCSKTPSDMNTTDSITTDTETATTDEGSTSMPETTDWSLGQSTGAQTKDVPNTEKGNEYRNTLVDNEIGIQVTCPPDKTWKCTLDSSGKFYIYDWSSNYFALRVVPGVSNADEAVAHEQKFLEATYPGVVSKTSSGDEATFTVGPDPSWATQVNRTAWLKVKEINGKFIACHGISSEGNFENASIDYKDMCDSVKAAQ